jgi:hypothetical protein
MDSPSDRRNRLLPFWLTRFGNALVRGWSALNWPGRVLLICIATFRSCSKRLQG